MPVLLAADDIREHVETDLSDVALDRILDALEAEMERYGGSNAEPTEQTIYRDGDIYKLWLPEPAASIQEIRQGYGAQSPGYAVETVMTEGYTYSDPENWQVVPADHYVLTNKGKAVMKTDGYLFVERIRVKYTPVDQRPLRRGVLIDLATLQIRYEGVQSVTYGRTARSHLNLQTERRNILQRLRHRYAGAGMLA